MTGSELLFLVGLVNSYLALKLGTLSIVSDLTGYRSHLRRVLKYKFQMP